MKDPFLSLDELERERDDKLASRMDSASRSFGQSLLNFQTLQQKAQERKDRLDQQAKLDARQKTQDDLAAKREARFEAADRRKVDDAKQAQEDSDLADAATARVAANRPHDYQPVRTLPAIPDVYNLPKSYSVPGTESGPDLPRDYAPPGAGNTPTTQGPARVASDSDIIEAIRRTPQFADRTDDSVGAAVAGARVKQDKEDAALDYKKEQAVASAGRAAYQQALLEHLPVADALKRQQMAERAEGIRQGWARLNQNERFHADNTDIARERVRLANEKQDLEKAGKLPPGEQKAYRVYEEERNDIARIRQELKDSNGELNGPIASSITNFKRKLGMLDPNSASYVADLKSLGNQEMHGLIGSAMTDREIGQVLPTLARLEDPAEVADALLAFRDARAHDHQKAIIDVASRNSAPGNTILERFSGKRTPAQSASPTGGVVMKKIRLGNKTKAVPADQLQEALAKYPGSVEVP